MLVKLTPDAVAVKTSINRVCTLNGIFKFVNKPFAIVPVKSVPVKVGVNVTSVPGIAVIILLDAADSYN